MATIEHPSELSAATGAAPIEASVCIIGSGPAGAFTAVALAAAGVDVVVLEAGSAGADHRIEAMIDGVDVSGGVDLRFGFSRQLGGATNLWSGRLAPFQKVDLESRSDVPESGWPLTAADLDLYYRRTAEILGIPGHDVFGESHPTLLSSDRVEIKTFLWAGSPLNAGDYLKDAAGRYDNLRVVLNSPVVRLIESGDLGSIEHCEIALPQDRTIKLRARYFVVAAGGIDTPRLLLNSNANRPGGVGNDHDQVGRYLSTHPKANMASLVLNRPVSTNTPLFTDVSIDGGLVRYGVGLSEKVQREKEILNHYVQLMPFLEYQANSLFERIKGSGALDSPLVERTRLIRGLLPGLGLIAFEAIGRLGRFQRRARKFILRAFLDQYPNPENRVTLSDKSDDRGMPLANIKWTWTERDRESVIRFFEILASDLADRGIGTVDYSGLEKAGEWPLIGIHSHFLGTTRMGDDPQSSVTTKDCRVHASDNLFIAGPSLFPVYGYANPVYTIGALSLRLADHLKERLK